jgi:hypothetical protein
MAAAPPGFVKMRCCCPRDHWEFRVGIGAQAVHHDLDDHTILVPIGPHARALEKAGYVVVSE